MSVQSINQPKTPTTGLSPFTDDNDRTRSFTSLSFPTLIDSTLLRRSGAFADAPDRAKAVKEAETPAKGDKGEAETPAKGDKGEAKAPAKGDKGEAKAPAKGDKGEAKTPKDEGVLRNGRTVQKEPY